MINKLDAQELIARKSVDTEWLSTHLIEALDKSEMQSEVIDRLLIEIDAYKRFIKELIADGRINK